MYVCIRRQCIYTHLIYVKVALQSHGKMASLQKMVLSEYSYAGGEWYFILSLNLDDRKFLKDNTENISWPCGE